MRIEAGGRRFWLPAVGGLVAASVAVVAGGRTMTPTTVPSTSWFGLVAAHGPATDRGMAFGLALFVALIALVVLWFRVVHAAARGTLSERQVWLLGAIWAAPFVVGPPIISKDVHAYAAQGILARHGLDPYATGVTALSRLHLVSADHALAAVDPRWRTSLSPYGPLATLLEHTAAAIAGGSPAGTVVVLRVTAALSVLAMCLLARALGRPHRAVAIAVVLLNPLVLVHGVSGAHFEAEMGALVMGGVLAAKRRSWVLAIALICAAGSVKAPAFGVLPFVVAAHVHRRPGPTRRNAALVVLRDAGVAGVCTLLAALAVPDGFGWARNLGTPSQSATSSVSGALSRLVRLITPPTWSTGSRTAVVAGLLVVTAVVVVRLLLRAREREVDAGAGAALVTVALLAPVFYPWYLLWGVTCWLVAACPVRRDQLLALCGVASVLGATGTPAPVARGIDLLALLVAVGWARHRARAVDRAVLADVDVEPVRT